MKTSQTDRNWGIPLMLAAALFSAGCERSQLPELRRQAMLLCAQPWGLFVVTEVALVATLVAIGVGTRAQALGDRRPKLVAITHPDA